MTSRVDFLFYSDGGSMQGNLEAAAACIVEDAITAERIRLLAYLGSGTNNEAEICGGLIGFSFLGILPDRHHMERCDLRWVCDSEYVLKSATSYIHQWQRNGWKTSSKAPVKNQGLWQAFLHLSKGIRITAEHVRGHTGHPENEECDAAIQWMKVRGPESFQAGTKVATAEVNGASWVLLDLQEWMESLRTEGPTADEFASVSQLLEGAGITQFTDTTPLVAAYNPLIPVLSRLREANSLAEKLRGEVHGASELATAISEVLKRFSL